METCVRIAEAVKARFLPCKPLTSTSDKKDASQIRALAISEWEMFVTLTYGVSS